jgi:hypothetical protein
LEIIGVNFGKIFCPTGVGGLGLAHCQPAAAAVGGLKKAKTKKNLQTKE